MERTSDSNGRGVQLRGPGKPRAREAPGEATWKAIRAGGVGRNGLPNMKAEEECSIHLKQAWMGTRLGRPSGTVTRPWMPVYPYTADREPTRSGYFWDENREKC